MHDCFEHVSLRCESSKSKIDFKVWLLLFWFKFSKWCTCLFNSTENHFVGLTGWTYSAFLLFNTPVTSSASCWCVSTCVVAKILCVFVSDLLTNGPFTNGCRPNQGPQRLKAVGCVAPHPWENLLIVPFRLGDRAECQNYAEKQHLPLALNQLCSVVTLTDQVDRVLQVNGVYN